MLSGLVRVGPASASRPTPAPLLRRIGAALIDNALLALPLAGLAAVNWRAGRFDGAAARRPSRAAVALLVTVPAGLVSGAADAAGGTPGKRLSGLRVVGVDGRPPGLPAGVLRGLLTVTLPWELGHQAVWSFTGGQDRRGAAWSVGAYGLLGAQVAGAALGSRRTYADLLAGTRVTS